MLLVALGGALGSVARYLTTLATIRWIGIEFPWGTLAVNLVGSLLIGIVHELGATAASLSPDARLFLTTGVMGGLTTYSAFSYETARLLETQPWIGWLYLVVTTAGCVALCLAGMATIRHLVR
jgi:fluoride exporter